MNPLLLLTLLFVFTSGSAFAAPDLDLRTLEGKAASLDDYVGKGKWTLVMFWATDCGICMREKPVMSDFHDAHKDKDAIVVGVAIDGMANVASVRDRIREHRTTYPTLVGELGTIAVNFEAFAKEAFRGTPTFWLFNPTGELLGVNPGPVRPEAIESFIARKSSL